MDAASEDTPTSGNLEIRTDWFASTVTFHADHSATVAVGDRTWSINLDNSQIIEI